MAADEQVNNSNNDDPKPFQRTSSASLTPQTLKSIGKVESRIENIRGRVEAVKQEVLEANKKLKDKKVGKLNKVHDNPDTSDALSRTSGKSDVVTQSDIVRFASSGESKADTTVSGAATAGSVTGRTEISTATGAATPPLSTKSVSYAPSTRSAKDNESDFLDLQLALQERLDLERKRSAPSATADRAVSETASAAVSTKVEVGSEVGTVTSESDRNVRFPLADAGLTNKDDVILYKIRDKMLTKSKHAGQVFRALDKDRDGHLTHPEFLQAVKDLGVLLSNDEKARLCWKVDQSKSGFINFLSFMNDVTDPQGRLSGTGIIPVDSDGNLLECDIPELRRTVGDEEHPLGNADLISPFGIDREPLDQSKKNAPVSRLDSRVDSKTRRRIVDHLYRRENKFCKALGDRELVEVQELAKQLWAFDLHLENSEITRIAEVLRPDLRECGVRDSDYVRLDLFMKHFTNQRGGDIAQQKQLKETWIDERQKSDAVSVVSEGTATERSSGGESGSRVTSTLGGKQACMILKYGKAPPTAQEVRKASTKRADFEQRRIGTPSQTRQATLRGSGDIICWSHPVNEAELKDKPVPSTPKSAPAKSALPIQRTPPSTRVGKKRSTAPIFTRNPILDGDVYDGKSSGVGLNMLPYKGC